MVLSLTSLLIYTNIGSIGIGLLFFVVKNYNYIMTFFFPNRYNAICMLELDNNVTEWIQKKTPDLTFKFNDGFYNMFQKSENKEKDTKPIYRSGNIGQFFYVEGNEDPIDFRKIETTGNPQLKSQLLKVDMAKLWSKEDDISMELFKKFGFWILIAICIAIIVIMFKVFKGGS